MDAESVAVASFAERVVQPLAHLRIALGVVLGRVWAFRPWQIPCLGFAGVRTLRSRNVVPRLRLAGVGSLRLALWVVAVADHCGFVVAKSMIHATTSTVKNRQPSRNAQ
jgi:hypothetical protein